MWPSKWIVKNIVSWSLAFIMLSLVGCLEPETRSEDQVYIDKQKSISDFYVEKGSGRVFSDLSIFDKWNLPFRRYVSFTVCLNSVSNRKPIVGQPFTVENKSGDFIFKAETNPSGCLTWREKTPFKTLGLSQYVMFKNTITGTGIYKGKTEVEFAVNPWANLYNISDQVVLIKERDEKGEQQYIDPSLYLDNEAEVNSFFHRKSRFPLFMDNVIIHTVRLGQGDELDGRKLKDEEKVGQIREGVKLEMNFQMDPKILIKDKSGSFVHKDIKAGDFTVWAQIIATDIGPNKDDKVILFPEKPAVSASIDPQTGLLSVPIKTMLTRRVAEGVLRLAIRVKPNHMPAGSVIDDFEGLYLLGEFNEIRGKKQPLYTKPKMFGDGPFVLETYLKDATNYQSLVKARKVFKQDLYSLSPMEIKWLQVQPGETSTTRTIEYRAKTCVTDMMTGLKMRDLTFNIRRIRDSHLLPQHPVVPEVLNVTTDENGCLAWVDEVTHKYYKPEDLLFPQVQIARGSFKKTLGMGINPWDDKFTFGLDLRDMPQEYIDSIQRRDKIPSRFFVTGYTYQTLRFRYDIDEYMNLKVQKTVLMRVDPEVLRYNSIVNGLKATEKLRDGIYLMKVALTKSYIDPNAKGAKIVFEEDSEKYADLNDPSGRGSYTGRYVVREGEKATTKEFISAVSKLVRVQSGKIITPIEFTMRDLRMMRVRNQFLIQLETIDEKKLQVLSKTSEYLKKDKIEGLDWMVSEIKAKIAELNVLKREIKELAESALPDFDTDERRLELASEIRVLENKIYKEKEKNRELLDNLLSRLGQSATNNPSTIKLQAIMNNVPLAPPNLSIPQREIIDDDKNLIATLIDFDIPSSVQDDILKGLERNDFTVNPAAPVAELNKLVDRDSGLEKRTFVGPMTLLLNGNNSNMRPTDSLDESFCDTDDCKESDYLDPNLFGDSLMGATEKGRILSAKKVFVDNSKYDHSKYFGSIRYLSKIHVDDLIRKKIKLEAEYRKNMKYNSLIYDFVKMERLTYVSVLKDDSLEKFEEEKCEVIDDAICLKKTRDRQLLANEFLKRIHRNAPLNSGFENINKDSLVKLIEGGAQYLFDNPELASGICKVLAEDAVAALYGKDKVDWRRYPYKDELFRSCYREAQTDPEAVLAFDKKIRVIQTGEYRFKGGKSMNINVAGNNSLNHNEGAGAGGSLSALLGFFPKLGIAGDLGSRVGRVSWDSTRSRQDGMNMQEATFLVMQTAALDIELLKHEKCLVIGFTYEFKKERGLIGRLFSAFKDGRIKDDLANQGYMLCTGKVDEEPTAVRERYYYFTQHFTDGDMLDSGDLYNHPWLLMLRGARDFRVFIEQMKGFKDVILTDFSMLKVWDRMAGMVLKDEAWAINQLVNAYRNLTPVFPGIYTVLDERYEAASYPWSGDPAESFDKELKTIGTGAFDKDAVERQFQLEFGN